MIIKTNIAQDTRRGNVSGGLLMAERCPGLFLLERGEVIHTVWGEHSPVSYFRRG